MIIAIDGTLASGKGTLAKRLAAAYNLPYLDTGRLYRCVGLAAMRANYPLDDAEKLAHIAETLKPEAFEEADLRTAETGQAASRVAALPEVRAALLDLQRRFAHQQGGAVLDGRDIGTIVCPEADIKLWIDAHLDIRAERRWKELVVHDPGLSLTQMRHQLEERDARDRSRKTAPMKPASDAVLIDTSDLTIDAAVDKARAVIEAVLSGA